MPETLMVLPVPQRAKRREGTYVMPERERNTDLEFMHGMPIRYNRSDFGRLETFVISVMEKEKEAARRSHLKI